MQLFAIFVYFLVEFKIRGHIRSLCYKSRNSMLNPHLMELIKTFTNQKLRSSSPNSDTEVKNFFDCRA